MIFWLLVLQIIFILVKQTIMTNNKLSKDAVNYYA